MRQQLGCPQVGLTGSWAPSRFARLGGFLARMGAGIRQDSEQTRSSLGILVLSWGGGAAGHGSSELVVGGRRLNWGWKEGGHRGEGPKRGVPETDHEPLEQTPSVFRAELPFL